MDFKTIKLEFREINLRSIKNLKEFPNIDFKQWCVIYDAYYNINYTINRCSNKDDLNNNKVDFNVIHNLGCRYFSIESFKLTEKSLSLGIKNVYGLKQPFYNKMSVNTYKNIINCYSNISLGTNNSLFLIKKIALFNCFKVYNKSILTKRINEFRCANKNICCNL